MQIQSTDHGAGIAGFAGPVTELVHRADQPQYHRCRGPFEIGDCDRDERELF